MVLTRNATRNAAQIQIVILYTIPEHFQNAVLNTVNSLQRFRPLAPGRSCKHNPVLSRTTHRVNTARIDVCLLDVPLFVLSSLLLCVLSSADQVGLLPSRFDMN